MRKGPPIDTRGTAGFISMSSDAVWRELLCVPVQSACKEVCKEQGDYVRERKKKSC